jgi:hypothetical protein
MQAGYQDSVLTMRIPVAEKAKPRKIHITGESETDRRQLIDA